MKTLYVIRDNQTGKFVCLIPTDEFDYFMESAEYASRFETREQCYRICNKIRELNRSLGNPEPSLSVDAI